MANDVVTSQPTDAHRNRPIDVDPGGTHGFPRWDAGNPVIRFGYRGESVSLTERHEADTLRDPRGVPESATAQGREILRAVQARAEEQSHVNAQTIRGRSRLGLDLAKFAAWVVSQPARRPRGRGTRTVGPMPIDLRLEEALGAYCARHDVSKRQVIECLLQELLAGDVPTNPVTGEPT